MQDTQKHLELTDIKIGDAVLVIDNLRRHGYHGRILSIRPDARGVTMIEFISCEIRFKWTASAMGLEPGSTAYWKTYHKNTKHDGVFFGHIR
ncbi:MAG: hypothetical protein WAW80_03700 [Candidatus Saccharimonadales bacterium]